MTLSSPRQENTLFGIPFLRTGTYDTLLQLEESLDNQEFQHLRILDSSTVMNFAKDLGCLKWKSCNSWKAIGTGRMLYIASILSGNPFRGEIDAKHFFNGVMDVMQDKGRKIYYISDLPASELLSTHLLSQKEFHFGLLGKANLGRLVSDEDLFNIAEDIADSGARVLVFDRVSDFWERMQKKHPKLLARIDLVIEYPGLKQYTSLPSAKKKGRFVVDFQRRMRKSMDKASEALNILQMMARERFLTQKGKRIILDSKA